MTGVNLLDDIAAEPLAVYEAALRHAAGFDVMANPWSRLADYSAANSLVLPGSDALRDDALYAEIAATGRGGLGTVIVQAAGDHEANANGEGLAASRYSLTVGATDAARMATAAGNYGANLIVAAPAASVTTDLTGADGFNDGSGALDADYTDAFGGTAAGSAVVSGVVALMLQANPGLGWRDVHSILALSARHAGSEFGAAAAATEVGVWTSGSGTQWNGGGALFHLSYGHGMVDAHAAVRMAEAWTVMQGTARTSANELTVTQDYTGPSVPIDDLGLASLTSTVTEDIEIETVYVTVELTHSYAWDLTMTLVAPDGTAVPFFIGAEAGGTALPATGDIFIDGTRWTFAIETLRGASSAGTWTLQVQDSLAEDIGQIDDFDLAFFGAPQSVNDIHHITNRFLAAAAVEPERQLIEDTNGGIDWLNLSALTGNAAVRMGIGGLIRVNNVEWADLSPIVQEFEHLYAGDGNDAILGTGKNNWIYGARGNDNIRSGPGSDRLFGGAGNDTLRGDGKRDVISGGDGNDLIDGGAGDDKLSGGRGQDLFEFRPGFGRDTITDFRDNQDTLVLAEAIWGGGLTVAEVIATYASVQGGMVLFDFGDDEILIESVASTAAFLDDITLF
jgi:subtilisin-like proprotein convertase family protein